METKKLTLSELEQLMEERGSCTLEMLPDGTILLAAGERALPTSVRNRHYKGSSRPFEEKKKENIWDCMDDFLAVLGRMRRGEWHWYLSRNCKYVNLRVDMRDGGCIIMNADNERIDPKDLVHQIGVKE